MTRWSLGALAVLLLAGAVFADGEEQTASDRARAMVQIEIPDADPARGRVLFVAKGCIACHAINELGGTSAPPLDAEARSDAVDPLDFVARMWRGAEAMIFMQQQSLGEQLDVPGQELADIIAFVHDRQAQRLLSEADVPPQYRRRLHGDPLPDVN
jgi:mono/diheme cytochrome c family protein